MVSCVRTRWIEVGQVDRFRVAKVHRLLFLVVTAFLVVRVTPQHRTRLFLFALLLSDGVLDGLRTYPYARLVLHFHGDGLLVVRNHDGRVGRIFGLLLRLLGWSFAVHVSVMGASSRNELLFLLHHLLVHRTA